MRCVSSATPQSHRSRRCCSLRPSLRSRGAIATSVSERRAAFVGVCVAVASTFRVRATAGSADENEHGRQAVSVWLGLGGAHASPGLIGTTPLFGPEPHYHSTTSFVMGADTALDILRKAPVSSPAVGFVCC